MTQDNDDALTAFQRDIVQAIARLASQPDTSDTKGLDILDWLEHYQRHDTVNHGRLYPNLDKLADRGLIRKAAGQDDRSNSYTLTDDGREYVEQRWREWDEAALYVGDD